jgi:polyhydroxyalkanoate synthase subunit PhaE
VNKEGSFSDDWLETQRKYWESWTQMSRKAMGLEGNDLTTPWQGALDHWWKAMSPASPPAAQDFMGKMMEQGKAFFRMAESFVPGAGGADAWSTFSKSLEEMRNGFLGSTGEGRDALHRMMAFWELPADNWQRMMSSFAPVPGDFLRNMPHDAVRGQMDRVLSAPGLGYTREEQSQYQDLMRRSMDYQQTLQDYMAFYSNVGVKSVDRMRDYMQSLVTEGKTIDSARAIYDNWVSCCEAVYGEEVSTPEYSRIHGRMINAQMALKQRMAIMVDESLGAMNMPTRSELRTLQDRLQETRRENKRIMAEVRALKQAIQGGGTVRASSQQSAPLRSALTSAVPASPLKKPAARKGATKPTTPTNK